MPRNLTVLAVMAARSIVRPARKPIVVPALRMVVVDRHLNRVALTAIAVILVRRARLSKAVQTRASARRPAKTTIAVDLNHVVVQNQRQGIRTVLVTMTRARVQT